MEKIKQTYEGLLESYPNTVRIHFVCVSNYQLTVSQSSAQIAYLNHYTAKPEEFGSAVALFKRYLTKSSSVDLWKYYLTFVR